MSKTLENYRTNEKNTCGLAFEEELEKYLKGIHIDPHFVPQESHSETYVLYPNSGSMHLGGSDRVPKATCMKRRGRF